MSDVGWHRLADLVAIGYQVVGHRSSERHFHLEHPGGGPDVGIWPNGDIVALGSPLWPDHLPYGDSLNANETARFQRFCFLVDQPSLRQERAFHVAKAIERSAVGAAVLRSLGAFHWHLIERWR